MKKELSAQGAKSEFVRSIHEFMMHMLKTKGKEEYNTCFRIEGSSIMCDLPQEYFAAFDIPKGVKIEMKFILKKNNGAI